MFYWDKNRETTENITEISETNWYILHGNLIYDTGGVTNQWKNMDDLRSTVEKTGSLMEKNKTVPLSILCKGRTKEQIQK